MAGQEGPPSDNLYVAGLPDEFTTEAVNQFFNVCGSVVQAKSLGHGNALVRFSSCEEAVMVKELMHNQQPTGCPKAVSITFATTEKHDDWMCPRCSDLQFAKNMVCRLCSCPRPTGNHEQDAAMLLAIGEWTRPAKPRSGKGNGKGNGKAGKGIVVQPPGDWTCLDCGELQSARSKECVRCTQASARWTPYETKGAGKGKSKGGGQGYTPPASGIKGVVDALITDQLPGGLFSRDKNALYLTNLPQDTTDADLYMIFSCFGAIPPRGVKVMPGVAGQRLYGFVNFMDNANAEFAMMALNGVSQPDGVKLIVKQKNSKGGKDAQNGTNGHSHHALTVSEEDSLSTSDGISTPPPGVDNLLHQRVKAKLDTSSPMSACEVSQWYIIEHLAHITDDEVMRDLCDELLTVCAFLGLS